MARFLSSIAIIVGGVVVAGWMGDIEILKSVLPHLVAMKANTALTIMLSGISLWILGVDMAKSWKSVLPAALAIAIFLVGSLSILEYVLKKDFGIDQLLFTESTGALETSFPGRMAPTTALCFVLTALAILADLRKLTAIARILMSVMVTVSLFSFVGYLINESSLTHPVPFTPMALNTSMAFLCLGGSYLSMRVSFDLAFLIELTFGGALVTVAYMGVISYTDTFSQINDSHKVARTHEIIGKLEGLLGDLLDMESATRGYIVTGNKAYLSPYYDRQATITGQIDDIRFLLSEEPLQEVRIDSLRAFVAEKLEFMSRTVSLRRAAGLESALRRQFLNEGGMMTMKRIRSMIVNLVGEENRLLEKQRILSEVSSRRAIVVQIAGSLASICLLMIVFVTLVRENKIRRESERETNDVNQQLRAAQQELEAFSYSVSHDLRAPLRHVVGFVDLLKKHSSDSLDGTAHRYLDTVSRAAKRMGTLIDDLLSFSRMGRKELTASIVNLNTIISQIIEDLKEETAGRPIEWKILEFPAVRGDSAMLQQVFSNLLENAVKFTRMTQKAVIMVDCDVTEKEMVVSVSDNGAGFDMQYADKLFGVFQRLHHADQFEGTGIGLANVRRIIHRHGGRTWAEGKPNEGATFYFTIPINNIKGSMS